MRAMAAPAEGEYPADGEGRAGHGAADLPRARRAAEEQSEKDAKLAQKLGQLQPSIAVFPQGCMG